MAMLFNRTTDVILADYWNFNDTEQAELDDIANLTGLYYDEDVNLTDMYGINVFPLMNIITYHCGNIPQLLCAEYVQNGNWNIGDFDDYAATLPSEEITDDIFEEME